MAAPEEWIEHRRGGHDRERLGWMRPAAPEEGEGFVVIDLLGREITGVVDWLEAEETLDAKGIGYLADPYELLLPDSRWLRVRILEVSPDGILVKRDDWGAVGIPLIEYRLPFPIPPELRVLDPRTPQVLPGSSANE